MNFFDQQWGDYKTVCNGSLNVIAMALWRYKTFELLLIYFRRDKQRIGMEKEREGNYNERKRLQEHFCRSDVYISYNG